MADVIIQDTTLIDMADAIREKKGTTDKLDPADYAALVRSIETSSGESSGGSDGRRVVTGTYYSASNFNSMFINCPFKPSMLFIHPYTADYSTDTAYGNTSTEDVIYGIWYDGQYWYTCSYISGAMQVGLLMQTYAADWNSPATYYHPSLDLVSSEDEGLLGVNIAITTPAMTWYKYFAGGLTYRWVAIE